MSERFRAALIELVLEGRDAGAPWMSDTLRSVADKMDSRPAGCSLRDHLRISDVAIPPLPY
jgi:hypothetical protein